MEIRSVVVAIVFGVLMGWGMSRLLEDVRPFWWAAMIGIGVGAIVGASGVGDDPGLVGGSLIIGCGSGLVFSFVRRSQARRAGKVDGPIA